MRSWAGRWVPVIGVYALILAVSAVPGDRLAGTPAVWSVVGHAVEYAVLAAAVHRAVAGPAAGLVAIATAVALGLVNELQQVTVDGRVPDVADVGVDGLGALAGVLIRSLRRPGRIGIRRRPGSRPPEPASAARRPPVASPPSPRRDATEHRGRRR